MEIIRILRSGCDMDKQGLWSAVRLGRGAKLRQEEGVEWRDSGITLDRLLLACSSG